jgi:hypothetical protein
MDLANILQIWKHLFAKLSMVPDLNAECCILRSSEISWDSCVMPTQLATIENQICTHDVGHTSCVCAAESVQQILQQILQQMYRSKRTFHQLNNFAMYMVWLCRCV